MSSTAITPERFDAAVSTKPMQPKIIWTLAGIAARIGCGPDFVRDTLAKAPDTPVKTIRGRYYAFEDELIAYLRSRAA